MKPVGWLLSVLVLQGCWVAAADHERLGDQAYRDQRFSKALEEYQAAQRSGAKSRVWAKAGAAALRAGDLAVAIEAYRELAREDPTRAVEAAVGLERIGRQADRLGGGQLSTIARVVLALRTVAPERPLGRLVLPLRSSELEPAEVLGLLPTALATAPTARGVDSLLLRYADVERATVACEEATAGYRAVLRRTGDSRLKGAAQAGLTECAVLLGLDALAARQATVAEKWFDLALDVMSEGALGWRARLGLGDARVMQGDALGAAVAYQAVLSASGVPDSVRASATAKLNSLGAASTEPPAGGDA